MNKETQNVKKTDCNICYMVNTTWEQTKMKEIFDDARKMKNGETEVESYDSIESFIKAVKND